MKWGTSEFKWLGLLEKLSTQDIGGEFGLQSSMSKPDNSYFICIM